MGFAELLCSESSEPRIKEYAENLIASAHALSDLMDEILEAVRVSSGEIPRLNRKFSIREILKKILALQSAKAESKKIKLVLNVDKTVPNCLIGDKIRIHRIILELVSNALNFTHLGYVHLNVSIAKNVERELVLKIEVIDTGIGIPKEKHQEIFLQFKRLTPSYQGIYQGRGLGLYIVNQFMDDIKGEFDLQSVTGKGTTFTCLFPLKKPLLSDEEEKESSSILEEEVYLQPMSLLNPTHKENNLQRHYKILIVEDTIVAQKVADAILTALGCDVVIAADGQRALSIVDKEHFDLILMDIGLGFGMDGYDVTRQIRKRPNEISSIPIVALTAHAGEENTQRAIEAGMNAVLSKPLTKVKAIDILDAFIPAKKDLPPKENIKVRMD